MEEKLEDILKEKDLGKSKISLLNEIIQNYKEEIEFRNNKIKIFKNKIVNAKDNIYFSENFDTKNDITTDSALSSNFNNNNLLGRKTNYNNFNWFISILLNNKFKKEILWFKYIEYFWYISENIRYSQSNKR